MSLVSSAKICVISGNFYQPAILTFVSHLTWQYSAKKSVYVSKICHKLLWHTL